MVFIFQEKKKKKKKEKERLFCVKSKNLPTSEMKLQQRLHTWTNNQPGRIHELEDNLSGSRTPRYKGGEH